MTSHRSSMVRAADEALGFSIGFRGVRFSPDVFEPEVFAGFGEDPGSVARSVVGHDAGHRHADTGVPGDGGLEMSDGADGLFIGVDPREGQARVIVDAYVHILPAIALPAPARIGLAGARAGDAVADTFESAELLDIEMKELAGMFALIAAHRLCRLQVFQACQTGRFQHPADGGRRDANLARDMLAGPALAAQGGDPGGNLIGRRVEQLTRP